MTLFEIDSFVRLLCDAKKKCDNIAIKKNIDNLFACAAML